MSKLQIWSGNSFALAEDPLKITGLGRRCFREKDSSRFSGSDAQTCLPLARRLLKTFRPERELILSRKPESVSAFDYSAVCAFMTLLPSTLKLSP